MQRRLSYLWYLDVDYGQRLSETAQTLGLGSESMGSIFRN